MENKDIKIIMAANKTKREAEEEYKQQLRHEVETEDDGPLVNWDMDLVTFEGARYVIEYIL